MKKCIYTGVILLMATIVHAAAISDFEDLTLSPESYWNGSDGSGGFDSGGATFVNTFTDWGGGVTSWDGFAGSNITDNTTPGYANQYSAITGSGVNGSDNYGIGYVGWAAPPTVILDTPGIATGAFFTNTTYAYLAMLNGEAPAAAFGPDDWFKLTVTGKDTQGAVTNTVDFLLADGTNLVNAWTWVDLTGLGIVSSLEFTLTSTDNGQFGMNTPAYFAIDDLTTAVPEPATIVLLGLGALAFGRKKS